jgi:hypothetical protein
MPAWTRIFLAFCLMTWLVAAAPQPADAPARALYDALNALRVDPTRVYRVHDLVLRRDAVRLAFEEGTLGLFMPFNGRVLGAVFTGTGRVLATPHDPVEKRSVVRFLGVPLVDEPISRAYLRFTDGTPQELEAFLQAAKAEPVQSPDFLADWNPVLANLNPSNSLRAMRELDSSSPLPYFRAGVVGELHGAFEVSVDGRRPEQVTLGQVRWKGDDRHFDLWAMFPAATGPGPAEDFVPVRYDIDTTIEDDLHLRSRARLVLRARRGGERLIQLVLSRGLPVESVVDASGQPLEFFQNEDVSQREVLRRGDDLFYVVLPQPARPGQDIDFAVSYSGTVITDAGGGVFFVGDRGAWYPHPESTASFCPFALNFRWPRKLKLVATGNKTEEHEEGETRVGRWISDAPVALAGFNLGDYTTASADAGPLHISINANRQLERALYDLFRSRKGVVAVIGPIGWGNTSNARRLVDITDTGLGPLPATVIGQLGRDIGDAARAMEQWNGPFPFRTLEVSPLPAALSQSWPGLIYLSTLTFVPKEAQRLAGVTPRVQFSFSDLMPFHELAHQWWGNVASFATYRDEWILEAFANYCALLYLDTRKPAEHVLVQSMQDYRTDLFTQLPSGNLTVDEIGPLALGRRLNSSLVANGYSRLVYPKATWVVHMLRMMLQEPAAKDPDARFRSMMRALLDRCRYGGLTESALEQEAERVMTPEMALEGGHSLDWFFEQWVHSTGIPRYSVDYKVVPHGKGFTVRGSLRQAEVPEIFLARVPLYAQSSAGKLTLLGWVTTSGGETPFQLNSLQQPHRIVIDPNHTLLCRTEQKAAASAGVAP